MLSRDEDHYVHPHDTYTEIHVAGPRGGIPSYLRKREDIRFIRFEEGYDEEELKEIFKEGARIAKAEMPEVRAARRGRPPGPSSVGSLKSMKSGLSRVSSLPFEDAGEEEEEPDDRVWVLRTPTASRGIGTDMSPARLVAK